MIGLFVGVMAFLVAMLANQAQGLAGKPVNEQRASHVLQQVEVLFRLSQRSRENMEAIYRAADTARHRTRKEIHVEPDPAGQKAAPVDQENPRVGEKRKRAAGELLFQITRKVWALSKNTRFYHYESLAVGGNSEVDDAALERYKGISKMLEGQFQSLNGDIETLRELCSRLAPEAAPLRKLKELAEKTARLQDQIGQTMKELAKKKCPK
jgi:hypothetical protein